MTSMMTMSNNNGALARQGGSFELAATASAAQAAAIIQAQYMIAFNRPRNMDDCRHRLMTMCQDYAFAEAAIYSKPVGKDRIRGLSIRAAEACKAVMGNMRSSRMTLWEDADKKITRVEVIDLQSNSSDMRDVTIIKSIERRHAREGQDVIGQRLNTKGETVYIVRPTDDEMAIKEGAACEKAERECMLKLLPPDWREEMKRLCMLTLERPRDGKSPEDERKALISAFASVGVSAADLTIYLGHSPSALAPKEKADLREIYVSIRDGEAVWADFQNNHNATTGEVNEEKTAEKRQSKTEDMLNKMKAKKEPEAAPLPKAEVVEVGGIQGLADLIRENEKNAAS
jgi:hypothetical protein